MWVRPNVSRALTFPPECGVEEGFELVKKKQRKLKPRELQPPPLENLLCVGEAVLYGQVCWSIANRGTEGPRPGEVITLEGESEERHHFAKRVRLTRSSIANIERCMGMKTCGEAVAMFAEEKEDLPADAPLGECIHGHQEAAFEFVMHGIEPTEPCEVCGEIPTFGNLAMSPSFYGDGPVKGVDGREYSTCPACGEDSLELQGYGIAKWGWNIVCLNCEWATKQAEALDFAQYSDLMKEVKSRVAAINQLMEIPGLTIRPRVESICL